MSNFVPPPPYRLNAAFAATVVALAGLQLFVVPLALLPQAPLWAGVVVVLISLATPFNTAVLHEAIHGRLARVPGHNDRAGRLLAICAGVAFDVVRFGHLSHHRFNRHALDRPDIIEPGQNALAASLRYYAHLLGGLYFGEIIASLVMLLPRQVIEGLLKHAFAIEEPAIVAIYGSARRVLDRRIRRIRADAFLVVVIYGAAFYLYGAWWPLLVAGIALRGLIVSLQDNLPHYGTPAVINTPAYNSKAPRWLTRFMLHQNLHAVHHDRPELHWNSLPIMFAQAGRHYNGRYVVLLVRQLGGPRRPSAAIPAE
jgi:fatty acid desaturase